MYRSSRREHQGSPISSMADASILLRLLNKRSAQWQSTESLALLSKKSRGNSVTSSRDDGESIRDGMASRASTRELRGIELEDFLDYIRNAELRSRVLFDVLPIGTGDFKPRTLKGVLYQPDHQKERSERIEEEAKFWLSRIRQKIENTHGNRGWRGSFLAVYFHPKQNYEHM